MACRNVRLNGLEGTIEIIHADFRRGHRLLREEKFDIVISNPPYLKVGHGRLNPCIERAVARHELKCTLEELVMTAADTVKEKGRFHLIYPVVRLDDLTDVLAANNFFPVRRRFIRAREETPPNLILVESGRKPCPCGRSQDSTLTLYDKQGNYSSETAKILFDSGIERRKSFGD
jgi:tRNA1(Val) A37 N6-methylase TrmN6